MLFNLLAGFLGSFATVRLSTWGIRNRRGPFRNVRIRGRHIHHFVPGILLAFGAGTTALLTDEDRLEQRLAVPMGAGIGLTFDEAALLLDLRDVYWTREGLLSVQLSLGATAILSIAILTIRMLRRGERRPGGRGADPARGRAARGRHGRPRLNARRGDGRRPTGDGRAPSEPAVARRAVLRPTFNSLNQSERLSWTKEAKSNETRGQPRWDRGDVVRRSV